MDRKALIAIGRLAGLAEGLALSSASGSSLESDQVASLAATLAGIVKQLEKLADSAA